jgi:acetylornithine deacetylase/succinyl-diaminopimelate desuccinylase-like protein
VTESDRIREFVQTNSRRFIETLKEACAIPSISAEGGAMDEMAGWLESRLSAFGAKVSRLEVPGAPPALLADIPGSSDRTLMVYDHYDVQPVDPLDLWDSPPFEPAERDGRLYARGAADNKGDLVARLCALETYRELVGDFPFAIKFFIEGEEETGSPHFHEICRAYADQLGSEDCVWEGGWFDHEGRPSMFFGCKGLLYVELRAKRLTGDQHSSLAVYAPSAAWELVRALTSIKGEDGRIAIDGFFDDILEPGPEELAYVERLNFEEESERKRLGVTEFVGGLAGFELKRELLYSPTANIAGFISGYTVPGASKTVLPAEAMVKVDFRLVPDQDPNDIAEKLRRHLKNGGFERVEVSVLSAEYPSKSPLDSRLGLAIRDATAAWFPKPANVWPLMYATGPMYPIARDLGIPISSPPGVGRPDSRIHAPNENTRIEDYLDIIGFTVSYLQAYAKG